jgi:hypothetical protein
MNRRDSDLYGSGRHEIHNKVALCIQEISGGSPVPETSFESQDKGSNDKIANQCVQMKIKQRCK